MPQLILHLHSITVFSWHTPSYAHHAERLAHSVRLLHLPLYQLELDSQGDWDSNVRMMGYAVRRALKEIKGDVLYVDADAEFRYRPAMLDYWPGHDIGVHYLYGKQLMNGTVYYSNNAKVRGMVREMMVALTNGSELLDQDLLAELIPKHNLSVCHLPPEYCCISDTMRYKLPGIVPIIQHYQASRMARFD